MICSYVILYEILKFIIASFSPCKVEVKFNFSQLSQDFIFSRSYVLNVLIYLKNIFENHFI